MSTVYADSNAKSGSVTKTMSASSALNDCREPARADDGASSPSSAQLGSSTRPPRRPFFDPWNSSSTGHQRAENRLSGSTSWRASRGSKLGEQYRAGLTGGGERVADTVGAGSPGFGIDGRKENGGWEKGAKGLRAGGQRSLVDIWRATKAGQVAVVDNKSSRGPHTHSLEDARGTSRSKAVLFCKPLTTRRISAGTPPFTRHAPRAIEFCIPTPAKTHFRGSLLLRERLNGATCLGPQAQAHAISPRWPSLHCAWSKGSHTRCTRCRQYDPRRRRRPGCHQDAERGC